MKVPQLIIYAIFCSLVGCQPGNAETERTKQESSKQERSNQNKIPGAITLSVINVSLSDVLRAIKMQTDYKFGFNSDLDRIKVTVNVKNASIGSVLDTLIKNYPIGYECMENDIRYIGVYLKK